MNKISTKKSNLCIKAAGIIFILFILSQHTFAHAKIEDLEKLSGTEAAFLYLKLGYLHILPLGIDHILFVLSLFLLNPKLKPLLWQASAFTIAHSVTLGLSMYDVIDPPAKIVEPLIALSIMYVALENIFSSKLKSTRIGIVFLFGLVHGMGFASALGQLGLPPKSYFTSLVMFNIGVELGQLTVIISAFLLIGKWFGKKTYYRKAIVIPLSILISFIAAYWTIQRLFF